MSLPRDLPESIDVAVIGGGIAGLSAAFELHSRGVTFVLVEASDRPGGIISTDYQDGFTIDAGPDAMLVQKPAALELCRDLDIERRLIATEPPRTAFVLRDGRLHPLPERAILGIPADLESLERTSLFSDEAKARLAREPDIPARAGSADDESIADFFSRRLGEEAVHYIAQPLLAGIHAGDARRLSVRALFPRLVEAEAAHGSLLRAFARSSSRPDPDGAFRSFPEGMGELVREIARALPESALLYGQSVVDLTSARSMAGPTSGGAFDLTLAGGKRTHARRVVLATPAYVTSQLVSGVNRRLSDLCGQVPYASAGTVALGYRESAAGLPLKGSGFIVPRVSGHRITAATWVSSKWRDRAPAGRMLLRAFVGGALDEEILDCEDAEIANVAHRELTSIMGLTEDPEWVRVYRWYKANAQYEVGHIDLVASIDERLRDTPGLFLTGSGFRGTGIPDCIADARQVAARAASTL